MAPDSFYDKQSAITFAKIEVYRKYIEGYLPKLLMRFGECIIIDLFCGPGKNGDNNGSPLALIDRSEYILSGSQLQDKGITIVFNDHDIDHIDSLKHELARMDISRNIRIEEPSSEKFESIMPKLIEKYRSCNIPKFFFLDPYTYSNVKMEQLNQIMTLPYSEVLLFIPIFFSYRFANDTTMPDYHKTRAFIEEFTDAGVKDYADIHEFMASVKEKTIKELGVDYIRPILLDDGKSKNSLFLITKHRAGMLLMNRVALNMTHDGSSVKMKGKDQQSLFGIEISNKYNTFKKRLIEKLEKEKSLTNAEIVEFAIRQEFLPKHAKQVMKDLYSAGKIEVSNSLNQGVFKMNRWNIAEKITSEIFFKWSLS